MRARFALGPMSTGSMVRALVLASVGWGLGACDDGDAADGCTRDTDCKGARICVEGACTDPATDSESRQEGAVAPPDAAPDVSVSPPDVAWRADLGPDARIDGPPDATLDLGHAARDHALPEGDGPSVSTDAAADGPADARRPDARGPDGTPDGPDAVPRDAAPLDAATDSGAVDGAGDADPRSDAVPPGGPCDRACESIAECARGPLCPGIGPDEHDDVVFTCLMTCVRSPGLADIIAGLDGCEDRVGFFYNFNAEFAAQCDAGVASECDEWLDRSQLCDLEIDCCRGDLVCVTLPTGPRCLRLCDAHARPTGCGEHEVCSPDDRLAPADRPSPGVCIPGDGCRVGHEDEACGPPSTCLTAPPATFCAAAGEQDNGDACEASFDDDRRRCQSGLYCAHGTCRPGCDAGCGEGARCIDYGPRLDGLDFRFCFSGCDLFAQSGCAEAQACALFDEDHIGRAMAACIDAPNGQGTTGEPCDRGVDYWGTCNAGHLCATLSAPVPPRCLAFCDSATLDRCAGASRCVAGLLTELDIGLCVGDCDPMADRCGPGQYCRFTLIGRDAHGADVATGFCAQGGPTGDIGEACEPDNDPATDSCRSGQICATVEMGRQRQCTPLCYAGVGSPNPCSAGFACRTGVFVDSTGVLSDRVGFCALP